jgi:magnesium transporter
MKQAHRSLNKKRGLAPGSLVYVGPHRTQPPVFQTRHFSADHLEQKSFATMQEALQGFPETGTYWIRAIGVHDKEAMESLLAWAPPYGKKVEALTLEDVMNTNARPKLEPTGEDGIFIIAKDIRMQGQRLDVSQVSFLLEGRILISFEEEDSDLFKPVMERLAQPQARIRSRGADYLMYALLDTITDQHLDTLEAFEDAIEDIEDKLLSGVIQHAGRKIRGLRFQWQEIRQSLWPMRDVINGLIRSEMPSIHKKTKPFLRDLSDHTALAYDQAEHLRDRITGLTDLHLSAANAQLNQIMKTLTVVSIVFMPLTLITGIYGMNFESMPELHFPGAYPAILIFMGTLALGLLLYFKKKKWL